MAESPSGDFYAVGVLQSVAFPTVYVKQHQLLKQQTRAAEQQQKLTGAELKRLLRGLYLELQYRQAIYQQQLLQDSLYAQISLSAQRQFDAGQVDFLVRTFASTQYGEVHARLLQAETDKAVAYQRLQLYLGDTSSFTVVPLAKKEGAPVPADSSQVAAMPLMQYWAQQQTIGRSMLSLEKHKVLPGLVFGYLNQGPRETSNYYKFRLGITVPLWFWQYTGNIKAARTGLDITRQKSLAQQQVITAEMQQANGDISKYARTLSYYETTGLKQVEEIITASRRFFESGEGDYISYLRNVNEGYGIRYNYLETLRSYNQALINMQYLTGN